MCFIHNCYNCYGFVTGAIIANGYKIVKFSGKHLSEHSIDQLLRSLFFRIFTGLLRHFIILRLLRDLPCRLVLLFGYTAQFFFQFKKAIAVIEKPQ